MTSDDAPPTTSLTGTAATGDRLRTLIALRDHLARTLEDQDDARATSALSKQLVDVMDRIEELGGTQKSVKTPLDELALRRAAKG
ncbi:hypothetical protein [Corynebacterium glyciniphilum]|uniref:hypothetical protein n=1 Tax=Corynebacterium glyciniphilum TaxID=1404244 RepID=UPI002650221D|nr:hypothetical protein [Corynebacterium glyciniphilum]MDN6706387.1 hypothetical protein [Corynebacterium glyciniphilum]